MCRLWIGLSTRIGTGNERISSPASLPPSLRLDTFRQQLPARAHVPGDDLPLGVHAEAGDALLVRRNAKVRDVIVNHCLERNANEVPMAAVQQEESRRAILNEGKVAV